jgi:cold shock CspA family protein/uncharacterized glyoxalase superfamily protein PhnB
MPQGTISRLNHTRGFGFLSTHEGEELFFHRTNVKDTPFLRLQVGDRVTYELQYTARGPRAGNVQLHAPAVQLQVNLAVRDLNRAVQFYTHALGFKQIMEHPGHILLHRGSLILGVKMDDLLWHPALKEKPTEELVRGVGVELVLEVSDIDEFHTRMQQEGVPIQEPLREQPWGAKDFRILDPDGYYWRVTSPRALTEHLSIHGEEEDSAEKAPEAPSPDMSSISGFP